MSDLGRHAKFAGWSCSFQFGRSVLIYIILSGFKRFGFFSMHLILVLIVRIEMRGSVCMCVGVRM